MTILVLNCGSSSIKYQVIDMTADNHKLLAKGLVERIGLPEGDLTHKPAGKDKFELHQPIADHTAVGHRVAHGGEYFPESAVVNDDVIAKIKSCFELAPLHNPANLQGILSINELLPGIPQVAVFDTSFHQSMPAESYLYALPYKYYDEYRVRKYGFHGTSHKFVAQKACALTGVKFDSSKIITCHIGNGASITAIVNGKSYDTSMGFTPVDGLMMGTRCGEVDPGALIFIAEKEGMSYADLNTMINKKSGLQGMTGISSDMRDIDAAVAAGDPKATVARAIYYRRVKQFIGSYAAEMGGVDLIVFTGGVGENQCHMREEVCSDMEYMGIVFDKQANEGARGVDKILSAPESKVFVTTIATDEELVIASDTFKLLSK